MTNPISAQLRSLSYHIGESGMADDVDSKTCATAADHIDAQDAKIAALVEALDAAENVLQEASDYWADLCVDEVRDPFTIAAREARAALAAAKEPT